MQTLRRVRVMMISVLCTLALTCKKEPPPAVYIPTLTLTAVDASCTEAWLKLTTTQLPATVRLMRDGQPVSDLRLLTPDTLVVDEGLLPRRTYTYKAYRLEVRGSVVDSSTQATVSTMDTTSHNFTWQIDTLGDGGGSVLYDVAIINDTLAYAVGEIYKRDSVGNWEPTPYGLAIWNGRNWTLRKLFAQYPGVSSPSLVRPHGIFAFSQTNIWFADADVFWWDGQSQLLRVHQVVNTVLSAGQYVDKLWGSSPSDIFAVGINGAIAHYDGVRWRRLESGTTLDVYDIYGTRNLRTGETEIYAVAAKQFVTFDRRILRVRSSGVEAVSDSTIPYSLHGVWFKGGGPYYVVGSGIYRKRDPMRSGPWQWLHPGVTPYYTYAIRGNDVNDIFICGSYGELLHFNGIQFRSHQNVPRFSALEFYELSCRNNLVVVVGYVQPRAVAVIGRRQ
jgi:hypothetical protein